MVIELNLDGRKATVDGQTIGLTKRETLICRIMSERRNQIVTRSRLLDLLASEGDENLTDRNLNNIVSRLRKKLNDVGPFPQVLETLYGDGYRWIYKPTHSSERYSKPHIFLNDLSSLDSIVSSQRHAFLDELKRGIASKLNNQVKFSEFSLESKNLDASAPNFCIEALEIKNNATYSIALNIRRLNSDQSMSLDHHQITDQLPTSGDLKPLCDRIHSFVIHTDITSNTKGFTADPLDVTLFNTTSRYESNPPAHRVTRDYLQRLMADNPNDPRAKILLALNMRNRLLMGYVRDYQEKLEQMIRLAQAATPELENDALYLAIGAEILYQAGFQEKGLVYANQAHATMTHPTATLKTIGKMHAFEGNLDLSRRCYQQAIAMTQPSSTYHYMLLTLEAITYKAEKCSTKLNETLEKMFQLEPKIIKRLVLKLMFYDGTLKLTFAERTLVKAMPKALLDRIVLLTYVGSARSFKFEEHRTNLVTPLLDFLFELRRYKTKNKDIIASLPAYFK